MINNNDDIDIKFVILINSYNNENWVEYNLASVLNQTYTNYKVIYTDDCSTDSTYLKVIDIVKNHPKFTIIKNEVNKGGTYNHISHFNEIQDEEVCILLDGDDWLFDDYVLEKLNNFYINNNCWMTYGQFYAYDGNSVTLANPQNTHYSNFIHNNQLYRRDYWRASHLRTYKGKLLKAVDQKDFISIHDKKLFWHAGDLALAYPCLEMCPKEKIGVVDFPTYVYNTTPQQQKKTRERETIDNSKYEIEIRNKKIYKRNGKGEKLDQINLIDGFAEYNTIPKKFSWCYNQVDGEFDMTLMEDWTAIKYIKGEIQINRNVPIVLRLAEHRSYFDGKLHNSIEEHYDKFHTIFTHDKELLSKLPNAVFMPTTDCNWWNLLPTANHPFQKPYKAHPSFVSEELPDDIFQIYDKSKLISVVASHKTDLSGHIDRLNILNEVKNSIDVFGTCQEKLFGKNIRQEKKFEALKDYAFSIAIENLSPTIDDYYFSEKITDCFITGTVPIYRGCKNIGKFFDLKGIIIFETVEELKEIISNLNFEMYKTMLPSIKINYDIAMKTPITSDYAYDYYYKKIIHKY
jgi:glycosyltransferase involved in cell wall biosynthesis